MSSRYLKPIHTLILFFISTNSFSQGEANSATPQWMPELDKAQINRAEDLMLALGAHVPQLVEIFGLQDEAQAKPEANDPVDFETPPLLDYLDPNFEFPLEIIRKLRRNTSPARELESTGVFLTVIGTGAALTQIPILAYGINQWPLSWPQCEAMATIAVVSAALSSICTLGVFYDIIRGDGFTSYIEKKIRKKVLIHLQNEIAALYSLPEMTVEEFDVWLTLRLQTAYIPSIYVYRIQDYKNAVERLKISTKDISKIVKANSNSSARDAGVKIVEAYTEDIRQLPKGKTVEERLRGVIAMANIISARHNELNEIVALSSDIRKHPTLVSNIFPDNGSKNNIADHTQDRSLQHSREMNVTELHELVVRTVEPDDQKILREILPHVNAEDYLNLLYAAKINGWRIHFEFKFDSRKEQPVNDKTFYKVSISMAFRPNHPEADSEVEIATIEPEIALPYKPHLLPSRQESKGQLLRELKKKEGLKLIFAEKFDQLITQNQALNSAIYQGITDEKIPKNSKQSLETLGPKLSLAQRLHRACEMAIARRITRSRVALDRSNVDLD